MHLYCQSFFFSDFSTRSFSTIEVALFRHLSNQRRYRFMVLPRKFTRDYLVYVISAVELLQYSANFRSKMDIVAIKVNLLDFACFWQFWAPVGLFDFEILHFLIKTNVYSY